MHYENLSVAVEPKPEGGYQARALASPFGPGTAPFDLPLRREELEELIGEVYTSVLAPANVRDLASPRDLTALGSTQHPSETLRRIGAHLFRMLLGGPVREIYLLSRGRVDSHPDRGLRIRVVLPVDSPEAGLLQAVPWELLYCEETRELLARSVRTPVVRILPLPWASVPFSDPDSSSIRILIAVANPKGTDLLDANDERDRILEAWEPQRKVELKILPACTLRDLTEALKADSYQAVHFITHGSFDPLSGAGSLLLEAPDGGPHSVTGAVLGETLGAHRELRAVFLNACRTSQTGSEPGQDPLLGTAAALVRAGVPAVLAMQFPISDRGARIFSETVYRSLARGGALDEAVAAGRLALVQADPDSREWITPSLFAALSESDVFRPWCSRAEHREVVRDEALTQLGALLKDGDYARAQQTASAALEKIPEAADLHYYLALALLRGRRARHLKISDLRPIEAAARRATRCPDRAAHHFCLLAFLVQDFYLENYLPPPPPPFESLLDEARAVPRVPERLAELEALVPWTASITARLGEPTERKST
jgi:tetratricopeptide (TPR) repeat protein